MARLGVHTLEMQWLLVVLVITPARGVNEQGCIFPAWWGIWVGGDGLWVLYGGDNIPVSPCGWQHLNSWLVHDIPVQTSATGAGCCSVDDSNWTLISIWPITIRWLVKICNNKSSAMNRPAWPRTRPKIMPRYVWHGPTSPHSKTVNQCCLNISSRVGNHLNNTASVFCVLTWLVQCSPNQIILHFIIFLYFFS